MNYLSFLKHFLQYKSLFIYNPFREKIYDYITNLFPSDRSFNCVFTNIYRRIKEAKLNLLFDSKIKTKFFFFFFITFLFFKEL